MELARRWPGAPRVAAPLKRLERLLSNRQVQAASLSIYQALGRWLVRQEQLVVWVDWREATRDGRRQLLRASVAPRGRSLTLYETVHRQRAVQSPRVHGAFLKHLKSVRSDSCRPVVVTDAGFTPPGCGRSRRWAGCGPVGSEAASW